MMVHEHLALVGDWLFHALDGCRWYRAGKATLCVKPESVRLLLPGGPTASRTKRVYGQRQAKIGAAVAQTIVSAKPKLVRLLLKSIVSVKTKLVRLLLKSIVRVKTKSVRLLSVAVACGKRRAEIGAALTRWYAARWDY